MELNYKALTALIEAVDHRLAWYEEQLRRTDLTQDGRSDLTNDMYYLRALRDDLRKQVDALR